MPAGRPTIYKPAIVDDICRRLARGETLRRMCAEQEHLPHRDTVNDWLIQHPDFSDRVARAREAGSHALIEENRDIADDGSNDWMEKTARDGSKYEAFNSEHVQRSKLRIEQRWREAEAILPKVYGKRTFNEISGSLQINNTNDDELIAELISLSMTGRLKIPGVELVDTEDAPEGEDGFEDIA